MWTVLLLLARSGVAQTPSETGVTVSGVVYDSIARAPLAGATVQLAGSGPASSFVRTVLSDSLGSFSVSNVPGGRYMLGFFHPLLETIGVEPPLREVRVEGRPVRVALAVPSPLRLRAAICGRASPADSSAAVVGVVRDAGDRTPVAGVTVSVEWLELTVNRGGFVRRVPRLVATTAANGWFALCNVPNPATVVLVAGRGADSTDLIEAHVPADGLLRRDLYLGPARTMTAGDVAQRADSATAPDRRVRVGDGRISGVVVSAVGDRALADARVSIVGGPETRANGRGEWTLVGAPAGTRMLQVRAVGHYPERVAVDVIPGAAPVRTALSTMTAVLDTVRITASRANTRTVNGFAERRHMGLGHYLTSADIMRRSPINIADMFYMVPGLQVDRVGLDSRVTMRGMFGRCSPALYLDGQYLRAMTADDINSWVSPDEVAGIEVYRSGAVPPQFEPGMSGCGSIVVWTQSRTGPADRRPMRQRFFTVAGALALGLLVGATLK